jgi:hypothetical protein
MLEIHIPCRAILRTNTRRCQLHAPTVGFLFFGGALVANAYMSRNPLRTTKGPGSPIRERELRCRYIAVSGEWLIAYERRLVEQCSLHASDTHMGWDHSGTKAIASRLTIRPCS